VVSNELKSHGLRTDISPANDAYFMKPLISAMAAALGTTAPRAVAKSWLTWRAHARGQDATDQKERTEDAGIAVVGMRVVEIGSRVALGDCGELLADFATEVLKVAPGGDTTKDRADSRRRAIDTVRADVSHGSTQKKRSITAEDSSRRDTVTVRFPNLPNPAPIRAGSLPRSPDWCHVTRSTSVALIISNDESPPGVNWQLSRFRILKPASLLQPSSPPPPLRMEIFRSAF
jgi:hypothetical protein